MSERAHTAGPWTFTVEDGDRYIRANGDTLMCDTPYYPWCPSGDANWHLIASAPELLECLKDARRLLTDQDAIDLAHIDEVIAKATK